MNDLYTKITSINKTIVTGIATVLETRAGDMQQREMLESYLLDIQFPGQARILEVGCGTGAVLRKIAKNEHVATAIGVDPSPVFLEQAKELSSGQNNLSFVEGEAQKLPFEDSSFDIVFFHTTLCHIPDINKVLKEARRVLKPGGQLSIFDADYSSTSLSSSANDPLKVVVKAAVKIIAHHPFVVPKLPMILRNTGFHVKKQRGYCYHGNINPGYMLTIVNRGADALYFDGKIGKQLSEAFKQEAQNRVKQNTFYGYINYVSFLATK